MAVDIIARGMITNYTAGTSINFTEKSDGTVEISASGNVSSEDSVARDAINNHKTDKNNPHNITPSQIGLGNVDNTSDTNKPVSIAMQQELNKKAEKNHSHTKLEISDMPTSLPANGGNADTVGGIQAADFRQITKTAIQTLPTPPITECDYFVSNADLTFPYPFGNLSIRYGSYTEEFVAIYQTTGDDQNVWFNVYRGNWTGWCRINDGGNADTVDDKHANDFIYARGYFDNIDLDDVKYPCSGLALDNCTHSPNNHWGTLLVYTGGTGSFTQIYISTEDDNAPPTTMYFRHHGNTRWSEWKEIYASGNKPYVKGSATVAANSDVCVTNHGFIASAIIWWDGNVSGVATSFSMSQFVIDKTSSVDRTINYLIFK